MVKIKRKVEMNLPQLIEWGFENDITNKEYVCNEHKSKSVIFNLSGWAEFSDEFSYNPHDTFTITTEEEITEDTEFEHLIEVTKNEFHIKWSDSSVAGQKMPESKEFHAYIDGEFKLIWRDGKLVE